MAFNIRQTTMMPYPLFTPSSMIQVVSKNVTSDIPIINLHASTQLTRLPATKNLEAEETTTLLYPSFKVLQEALVYPSSIDKEVIEKIFNKLKDVVGKPLYPSQLAKLIFELAFTDEETLRLTSKQRTDNIGYALSNLGCGKSEIIEKLYAFYYAYSFEHFASVRNFN